MRQHAPSGGARGSSGSFLKAHDPGANRIERLELNSGEFLTDADINKVLADMAAYVMANSIDFTSLEDVKNDANLLAIVNAGWHS